MKVGVIGFNDAWSSLQLAKAVSEKFGFCPIIEMKDVAVDLFTKEVLWKEEDLTSFDLLLIKKISPQYSPDILNRLEILRHLESKGVQIFSSPLVIAGMINRMNCILALQESKVPMLPTLITENIELVAKFVHQHQEVILKPLYTSKAKGMKKIRPTSGLIEEIKEYQQSIGSMIFAQKMVHIPGQDLGVTFLGDRYVATYARVPQGEWVQDQSLRPQGKYQSANPSQEIIELARKAKNVFNLELSSVDIVETDQGPKVFEVSAFGGFRGLWEGNSIDLASLYVEHIARKLK